MGVKISELTTATSANNNDVLPIVQNGETKQISKGNFLKELNTANSFSTNEVEIGTWINGNTLYRKVYQGTVSNIESICNADSRTFIVNMYGHAVAQNGVRMPMNNSFSTAYVWAGWWNTNMSAAFNFGSNFTNDSTVVVVIEYTK